MSRITELNQRLRNAFLALETLSREVSPRSGSLSKAYEESFNFTRARQSREREDAALDLLRMHSRLSLGGSLEFGQNQGFFRSRGAEEGAGDNIVGTRGRPPRPPGIDADVPTGGAVAGGAALGDFGADFILGTLSKAVKTATDLTERSTSPFEAENEKVFNAVDTIGGFIPGVSGGVKSFYNEEGITQERQAARIAEEDTNNFIQTLINAGVDPTDDQIKNAAQIFSKLGQAKAEAIVKSKKFISNAESEETTATDVLIEGLDKFFDDLFVYFKGVTQALFTPGPPEIIGGR